MEYFNLKKSTLFGILIFGLIINTVISKPQNLDDIPQDDDYDYNDDSRPEEPKIISSAPSTSTPPKIYFDEPGKTLTVKEGDNVRLTCNPINLRDDNVVSWYNGTNMITLNRQSMNERVKIDNPLHINIHDLKITDRNHYFCRIIPDSAQYVITLDVRPSYEFDHSSYPEYPEVPTHHMETVTTAYHRPTTTMKQNHVEILAFGGRTFTGSSITIRENTSIELECVAHGLKNVTYRWSLDGQRAKNVTYVDEKTGKLKIDSIEHHQAGLYTCLADDGGEHPLSAEVKVIVQYAPKVWTHRHHVNTAIGDSAELHCDVKGEPIAYSQWKKVSKTGEENIIGIVPNKYRIDTHGVEENSNNKRNITKLHIKDVTEDDIGEYICSASNSLGKAETKVYLILEPERPQFEDVKFNGRIATIYWLVNSKNPLREASIYYKMKNHQTNWNKAQINMPTNSIHSGTWRLTHEVELTPGIWHVKVRVQDNKGLWSEFSHDKAIDIREDEPQEIQRAEIGNIVINETGSSNTLLIVPSVIISCLLFSLQLVPSI